MWLCRSTCEGRPTRAYARSAAAIVAPTSFDDKGLALARELCADGCKVIVLTNSHEAAQMGACILPDAHAFLAQPVDEQRLKLSLPKLQRRRRAKEPHQQWFCGLRDGRLIWQAMCLSMRTGAKYRSRMRNSSCWHYSRAVVAESFRVISCELGSQGATLSPTTVALTCSWRDCGVRLSQMRNLRALSSLCREWGTNLRQQCGKPTWRRHRRSSRSEGERRAAPSRASAAERPSVPDPRMGGPIDPARS